MASPDLATVARAVLQRAQQAGYVLQREIREELSSAGLAESRWKEVVELLRESLNYRQGRYYFLTPASPKRQRDEEQRAAIQRAIRAILQEQTSANERRIEERVAFIHPIAVRGEDGKTRTLLSRDLSLGGIRLVSARSLLGHRLQVTLPQGEQLPPCILWVRIVWAGALGDELFENGGTFLEMAEVGK